MIASLVDSQRAAQAAAQPKTRLLPEPEREQLLEALKLKWEQANSVYQTMTHNTMMDTKGKMRRSVAGGLEWDGLGWVGLGGRRVAYTRSER